MKNEVTLDDLNNFLSAARADLIRQQKEFREKNAAILDAVAKADQFAKEQKDKLPKNKIIQVTEEDGKVYTFDPFAGLDEPNSLSEYRMRRDEYTMRLLDLEIAFETLQKLQTDDKTKVNYIEILPITRIFTLHQDYFDRLLDAELSKEEKEKVDKQKEVLNDLSKLIEGRTKKRDKTQT